jgi:hypothetical protein
LTSSFALVDFAAVFAAAFFAFAMMCSVAVADR